MKNLTLSIVGVFVSVLSLAQGTNRTLPSFSEIHAQEGIQVYLSQGDDEAARIEASGINVQDVLTEVSGNDLKIHLRGNSHRNTSVKVYVTYQQLNGLSASSSASIQVEGVVRASGDFDLDASSAGSIAANVEDADDVEMEVSSSGSVKLTLSASSLEAEVSSSGKIEIRGEVGVLDVEASSSGEFDGYDLTVREADVTASSGSRVNLTVTEELDADANSGASVRYKGDPKQVDGNSSSGGTVKRS